MHILPVPRWLVLLALQATAGAASDLAQPAAALLVEEVAPDSLAAKAGMAPGDGVLTYDARPLPSPAALLAAEDNTFGRDVTVRVQRGTDIVAFVVPTGRLGLQVRPAMAPEVLALYGEGLAAERAKRTDDAIARWTAAARAAADGGDRSSAAWLYGRVGLLHESSRRFEEAVAAHGEAWERVKQDGGAAAQSFSLAALGRSSASAGDASAAREWYEREAAVDQAAGHEWWLASTLSARGNLAYSRGDFAAAQELFASELRIRERQNPAAREHAGTLNNLGNTAERLGDLAAAQDYHTRALAAFERLAPDSVDVARSLNNLGQVAYGRGDLEAALDFHRRSLRIKERVAPDSLSMAASFNNLGNVSRARGDSAMAFDYHTRALRIRERLAPDSIDVATSLNNLGNILTSRGELASAEEHHRRALAIREKLSPDSLDVATSLANLGDIAQKEGDLVRARELNQAALAIKERRVPGSLHVAADLSNLGVIARAAGDTVAAQDLHRRALAIRERDASDSLLVAASLNHLGGLALSERRFADAITLLSRAVAIVEGQRWRVRFAESRALLMAQYTAAYIGLVRAQAAQGDVPAAFASAERLRARSLLDSLAEAGAEIRSAVDPALLARERDLQLEINDDANRQLRVLAGAHSEAQAAAAQAELDAVLARYRDLQSQIRAADPRYAALTQPQPLGLAEVQRDLLDEDALLLAYVLGDEGSTVFAITRSTSRSVALAGRPEVEAAARRVRELMTARQPVRGETPSARRVRIASADAAYPAAAVALSRMVLAPVADLLGSRRLLIVADGALHYIPFAALPDPVAPAGAAPPPLIVGHEVVSLPSASVLASLRTTSLRRPPADREVTVVADPVFERDDVRLRRPDRTAAAGPAPTLPAEVAIALRSAGLTDDLGALARLPFTRGEARAILALAPRGQAGQVLDFAATRAAILGPDCRRSRVVHIATHGLLDDEHPELSGLVLSLVDERGRPQDGFLRLHEIYNLEWSAELVVLSACQTGLGKEIGGEGLVGLTRGFMHAGARRVMASLWNVNDNVTAELMRRFYEGLFVRQLSPPAALRAAQVGMWKRPQWRSPYHWAAFVLHGG